MSIHCPFCAHDISFMKAAFGPQTYPPHPGPDDDFNRSRRDGCKIGRRRV